MSFIYTINGIAYLSVALLSFYIYYSLRSKDETSYKIGTILGMNGIFYLLIAFLQFFWIFSLLQPNEKDFLLVKLAVTSISSLLLAYAVYKVTENKSLVYMLVLFIVTTFAVNFALKTFFTVTLAVSYLLLGIAFHELFAKPGRLIKLSGLFGVCYIFFSIIIAALILFGYRPSAMFWFLPTTMLSLSIFYLWKDIADIGIIKKEISGKKKKGGFLMYTMVFFRFFLYISSVSGFMFISTIAVHELGHAFVAQYYGCSQFKAVIYDAISAHTEIQCDEFYNDVFLTLAGLIATTFLSIIFFVTGGWLPKELSMLIASTGMMLSYGDLTQLKVSTNLVAMIFLLGLIFMLIAIVRISSQYLRSQNIFIVEWKKPSTDPKIK